MLYGTGFGTLSPQPPDGQAVGQLASTKVPVTATIDGVPAVVSYAGAAPGLIAGVTQVNVQIPADMSANASAAVVLKSGFQFTAPATGYVDMTVAAKTGVTGKSFGARLIPKPSIGGTLFDDANGNGVRDPGEAASTVGEFILTPTTTASTTSCR